MNAETYRHRLAHAFHVAEWPDTNPFRAIAIERLESPGLSRLGGLHAPSTVATDRRVQAEEAAIELMRDLPASVTQPATEF